MLLRNNIYHKWYKLMKQTFYTTLILFLLVLSFFAIETHFKAKKTLFHIAYADLDGTSEVQKEIIRIDQELKELQSMKRGYEARALRHDDQAQRLQFEDRAVLETRRHNELADENRAKAARVQERILELQEEKQRLLEIGS